MAQASFWIHLHALAVVLSLTGFVIRGIWMLADSPMLRKKWVKITPHVVDTVLLVSALAAAWLLFWSNGAHPSFITVKIVGLIVYIGLGLVAMRFGRTRGLRASAWVLAILVFLYVAAVGVANTHPQLQDVLPAVVTGV
ncbi:MAG: SirB2 family protein [Guyparkeria sp.]|uniref:SirB2 family protein n=1 Tax=Guyparkeria sp. TaxID=2035736 RepID=UPI00397BEAA1